MKDIREKFGIDPELSKLLSNTFLLRKTSNFAVHECSYQQMQLFLVHLRNQAAPDEPESQKKEEAILLLKLYEKLRLDDPDGVWWSDYLATL